MTLREFGCALFLASCLLCWFWPWLLQAVGV